MSAELIAAGAMATSQTGNGILGYLGANRQMKHSKQMMHDAQLHEINMWQKQADYNAPEAQMDRLKAAGLNPNLIYGTGAKGATGVMNTAPATYMQNTEVPNALAQIEIPNMMSILHAVQNAKANEENLKILGNTREASRYLPTQKNLETNILEQQWDQERLKADKMDMDNFLQFWSMNEALEARKADFRRAVTDAEKAKAETAIRQAEARITESLKTWNITSSDQVGLRALIKLLDLLNIVPGNIVKP